MKHVLLLGAGFSRNWGGLLAGEVFGHIAGDIASESYVKDVLWKYQSTFGFESALAEVQRSFSSDPSRYGSSLRILQAAVLKVFQSMNQAFFDLPDMEFQHHLDRMLRSFLFRFDAIFTLNQDLLLDHHYFRHVELSGHKWVGIQLPGLRRIPSQNADAVVDSSWAKDIWVPMDESSFRIEKNLQPIFKLHGSSNWRDSDGGELLIIGGEKESAIRSHAVLAWSFKQFQNYLMESGAKLFVIGYGFRDRHVNDVIIKAVDCGLKFFLIDPLGSEIVRRVNPSYGGAIYAPNALDETFKKGLIGVSQRSLSETFGNDQVSHNQVKAFFK